MKKIIALGCLVLAVFCSTQATAQAPAKHQKVPPLHDGSGAPHLPKEKFSSKFSHSHSVANIIQSAAVTIPTRFPYQNTTSSNQECVPVALPNGQILFAWSSFDSIYCAFSSDNGQSWSAPIVANTGVGFVHSLAGLRTSSGRIIMVWRRPGFGLFMSFSSDGGLNWFSPLAITNDYRDIYSTLSQTSDGKLWLFYSRIETPAQYDIFFRTSVDGGNTWSVEQAFVATSANELYGTVVSGDGSTLLAIYESDLNGDFSNYDILRRISSDGGATWSTATSILNSPSHEVRPRVLRQTDSALWLIYQLYSATRSGLSQYDLYFTKSTNNGTSWSAPERFTTYGGYDGWHNADLLNNQPFVAFASERWGYYYYWRQTQIGYGIIGTTQDQNPPPALLNVTNTIPKQNAPVAVQAYVEDETGVSAVEVSSRVNGVSAGPFPMFDDGAHRDSLPNDYIWGVEVGPFLWGDFVGLNFSITDVTANTVNFYAGGFEVVPFHDAGNLLLSLHDNSQLGGNGAAGLSAHWPRENGHDYLYVGGLWAGANVAGENRVMNVYYSESDWSRTVGSAIALEPGISDQDGEVTYDDNRALSAQIGLRVRQNSFQWSAPTRDDFIILRYTIENTGQNGNLSQVYLALWLDPDVALNADAYNDLGGYDAGRSLLYLFDSQNIPPGYLGLKLLGTSTGPHTAQVNASGTDPDYDSERFQFMTAGIQAVSPEPSDYRLLLTAPPFDLPVGQTHTLTFGLVMGNGLAELQAHADTMEAVFRVKVGVEETRVAANLPKQYALRQNYPNPFNPSSSISYSLPERAHVKLEILNTLGQVIAVLVNENKFAGEYSAAWLAEGKASGVYLYRLTTKNFVQTRKLLLLR